MVNTIYNATVGRIMHLDHQQMGLLVVAMVVIGFWCMRGFGSRSAY